MSEIRIKVGDWIEIPKGTRLLPWQWDRATEKVKRVQVTAVETNLARVVSLLMTDKESRECMNRSQNATRDRIEHLSPEMFAIYERIELTYKDQVLARHPGATPVLIGWTKNPSDWVMIDAVKPIDAPAAKPTKAPTKQQQIVPKSVWRVTETVDIAPLIKNPAWWAERDRVEPKPDYRNWSDTKHKAYLAAQKAAMAHMETCGIPQEIGFPYIRLEAGTEIVCSGKRTASLSSLTANLTPRQNVFYHGGSPLYPFKVPATGATWLEPSNVGETEMWLPYDQIAKVIELVDMPQVKVWYMRDQVTGQYFKGAEPRYKLGRRTEGDLLMVAEARHARKYDDISKLKASITDFTGYHHGMPTSEEGRPDWMGDGERVCDLPKTFEAVCFDKMTGDELETVDLQTWHDRLWRLRSLTIDHGSVVRKIYADLEKKGDLATFSHILCTRVPVEDTYYTREITPEEIEAFEVAVASLGLKKTEFRRARNKHSMAVAFKDPAHAFHLRLVYPGLGGSLGVLNLVTLQESVGEAIAA